MSVDMEREARISGCGNYRYWLSRRWEEGGKTAVFVMLNPSTADAAIDDPTIRSCVRLAKERQCGRLIVVNLFAWRATNPKELDRRPNIVGPHNNEAIIEALGYADFVICAWGAHSAAKGRDRAVIKMIKDQKFEPLCYGMTKSGAPKHPLYIKSGTPLDLLKCERS